jgi:hypothetical protein
MVYKLQKILDDPSYEGFASDAASVRGKRSLLDDFMPDSDELGWEAPVLSPVWKPLRVRGKVRATNDYPCLALMIPVFSRRAVDALQDLLVANGELLPLISEVGEYYAYNVRTVADILDRERSDVEWLSDDPGPWDVRALVIDRFEFKPTSVEKLAIFQLPELAGRVFVTDRFRDRVMQHKLDGFDFIKVWSGASQKRITAGRRPKS